jgi:hypothetical protein
VLLIIISCVGGCRYGAIIAHFVCSAIIRNDLRVSL